MTKSTTRVAADLETFTQAEITAKDVVAKAGRRNLIINGGFDVWQRGTSMSNPSSTHYLADRVQFYGGSRGDSLVARSTDVPAGERFKYSMAVTAIQANGLPFYRQPIEDFTNVVPNTHDWAMSFWAKASVPMTISSDLGDQASQTHSLTTSWQRFTNIVPAGTAFTYSAFDLQGNSSAGIIYVTGCQLELGSVATDFEHRSYGEELALCQRYYQILDFTRSMLGVLHRATSAGSGSPYGNFTLATPMRAYPTMTAPGSWGTAADQAGVPDVYEPGLSNVTLRGNNGPITAGGSQWIRGGFCNFDAEL